MSALALRSSYRRSALRLVSFSFLTFLLALPAFCESHVRIVRLSYVNGDVEIDKGDGHGFITAFMNMPVLHQSKLWAKDGIAEVEFENGSSIRLTPDTIVAFNDLSSDADGRLMTKVELNQGTAYFDIRHRDPDTFELELGRDRVKLPQSAHFRVDSANREFEIAVLGGELQVANGDNSEVAVKKDETIHLDTDQPDKYQLAKGIDSQNYDNWDHDRSQGHDQAVSTASVWNGSGGGSSQTSTSNYPYSLGYGNAFGWGSPTLLIGSGCGYSGFGSPFGYAYPWGSQLGLSPFDQYGYGWCPSYYPTYLNTAYVPYPVRISPSFRPHIGPRPRPVTVAGNSVIAHGPERRVVIDNDVLEQRYPHAATVTAASGARTGVPAQGFAGGGAGSTTSLDQITAVGTTHIVASPAVPLRPPILSPQGAGPSMASHGASSMHSGPSMGGMSGPRMSSMGGTSGGRMSSMSSMSSGGGHMSGPSMGGGGGGMHSGGGGGGSHR